jgi:hypothetical protein
MFYSLSIGLFPQAELPGGSSTAADTAMCEAQYRQKKSPGCRAQISFLSRKSAYSASCARRRPAVI